MQNWLGLTLFLGGGWLLWSAFAHRQLARTVRREAEARGRAYEPYIHPGLDSLRHAIPPIIIATMALLGLICTYLFAYAPRPPMISAFDLAGLLFLMLGFSVWVYMWGTYLDPNGIQAYLDRQRADARTTTQTPLWASWDVFGFHRVPRVRARVRPRPGVRHMADRVARSRAEEDRRRD